RVDRRPPGTAGAGQPRRRLSNGPGRLPVLIFRRLVVLDQRPALFGAALDHRLGANQSWHQVSAATLATAAATPSYAPQRQRFPIMASTIWPVSGLGSRSSSATADISWPGVQ